VFDVTLQDWVHSPTTFLLHPPLGPGHSGDVRVKKIALGWASPIPWATAGPHHLQGDTEVNATHLDCIIIWKDIGQLTLGHTALKKPRISPNKI